ncbi:MAG: glycosyl hydrolase, partial [Sphingobacterium siyangense]
YAPFSVMAQQGGLNRWPKGKFPMEIGNVLAGRFIQSAHSNWGNPGPAQEITYPETCTWFGALLFAQKSQNKLLLKALQGRYEVLSTTGTKLVPKPDHVDHTVFGSIPLELYRQTDSIKYLKQGLLYADAQWELPFKAKPAEFDWHKKGYSWQTRL